MTNRDWFCLGVRLLGIWMLIQAVEIISQFVLFLGIGLGQGQNVAYYFYQLFWIVTRTAFALGLLLFAPALTLRFYPMETATSPNNTNAATSNAFRVALRILGIYALLLALEPLATVIGGVLSIEYLGFAFRSPLDYRDFHYLAQLVNCGLHLGFAILLLLWNDRIIALLAKIRYVPERDAYEPPPLDE